MSCARTSDETWWARILYRLGEFLHKYPKLPKKPFSGSSLIGSKITIEKYNTFLHNNRSSGYKFWFDLNDNNKTGNVYIIGITSVEHESVVFRLQEFFKVPNNGTVDDPPIIVCRQPFHYEPGGTGVEIAPDVAVYPDIAIVPRPSASTVIPRPPSDVAGNPHARIICEVAVGQNKSFFGHLGQRCLVWMKEKYVRVVISIKIFDPMAGIREPVTGYFYRAMTAKLYREGMAVQCWDFGNVKKYSKDPINDPVGCNAPNLSDFQITIPISEVFWDPLFPVPPAYVPIIPTNIIGNDFIIDLYQIQRIALKARV